jgi:hypothetical protein
MRDMLKSSLVFRTYRVTAVSSGRDIYGNSVAHLRDVRAMYAALGFAKAILSRFHADDSAQNARLGHNTCAIFVARHDDTNQHLQNT